MSKLLFGNYCPSLRKKHDGEIGIETMHKQPGVNIVNIFDLCLGLSFKKNITPILRHVN